MQRYRSGQGRHNGSRLHSLLRHTHMQVLHPATSIRKQACCSAQAGRQAGGIAPTLSGRSTARVRGLLASRSDLTWCSSLCMGTTFSLRVMPTCGQARSAGGEHVTGRAGSRWCGWVHICPCFKPAKTPFVWGLCCAWLCGHSKPSGLPISPPTSRQKALMAAELTPRRRRPEVCEHDTSARAPQFHVRVPTLMAIMPTPLCDESPTSHLLFAHSNDPTHASHTPCHDGVTHPPAS